MNDPFKASFEHGPLHVADAGAIERFGLLAQKDEGGVTPYDPIGDGIAMTSIAHPQTISPLRAWLAAGWFNARCATADALVWLAEKIGPFQYYGRDK